MLKHWKKLTLAIVAAGAAAVILWAPYLPRRAYEGFPAPTWPARILIERLVTRLKRSSIS